MARGSWAKRGQWDDRNSYFFGINASYFNSGTSGKFIPLVGSISEGSSQTDANSQFIPPNSGRLVSLSIYSSNATAPGSTTIAIRGNGGPNTFGTKVITIPSQTLETFNFKDELASGTFEWDINDLTSVVISLSPTNAHDNMNVFVLFEIYK